jgi:proteasome lid subunit RPN8/RPN11
MVTNSHPTSVGTNASSLQIITTDASLSNQLKWTSDLWFQMSQWRAESAENEASGYAAADPEGNILWQCRTASGSRGAVISTANAQAAALWEAAEKGLMLNVQWHTHGDTSPFFSLVDENAQREYLEHTAAGKMWFVCFGSKGI